MVKTERVQRKVSPAEGSSRPIKVLIALLLAIVVGGLFIIYRSGTAAPDSAAAAVPESGRPGIGEIAPALNLASSSGGKVSLASLRGKTVLLYFQEGLTCQPCWDQLKDLEKSAAEMKAAGVDAIISITTDPVDLITQKVQDDGLSTQVLSDPDLAVSRAYHANSFGMMGDSRDGHTFILVDPSGNISWRADYGGAPNFTMYVTVQKLLADLKVGRK